MMTGIASFIEGVKNPANDIAASNLKNFLPEGVDIDKFNAAWNNKEIKAVAKDGKIGLEFGGQFIPGDKFNESVIANSFVGKWDPSNFQSYGKGLDFIAGNDLARQDYERQITDRINNLGLPPNQKASLYSQLPDAAKNSLFTSYNTINKGELDRLTNDWKKENPNKNWSDTQIHASIKEEQMQDVDQKLKDYATQQTLAARNDYIYDEKTGKAIYNPVAAQNPLTVDQQIKVTEFQQKQSTPGFLIPSPNGQVPAIAETAVNTLASDLTIYKNGEIKETPLEVYQSFKNKQSELTTEDQEFSVMDSKEWLADKIATIEADQTLDGGDQKDAIEEAEKLAVENEQKLFTTKGPQNWTSRQAIIELLQQGKGFDAKEKAKFLKIVGRTLGKRTIASKTTKPNTPEVQRPEGEKVEESTWYKPWTWGN